MWRATGGRETKQSNNTKSNQRGNRWYSKKVEFNNQQNMSDDKQTQINCFQWVGRQIELETMSAEEQAICFEQMKQAINNRERENWINETESIFDNAETQVRGRDLPASWTSSGFVRPPPLSNIQTGKYSPRQSLRFKVPKETGFINTRRGGYATTHTTVQ